MSMNIKRLILSDYRYQVGLIILVVILGISIRGYATRNVEYTNNATVQCNLIDVVSEVNGVIEKVDFEDDQWVSQSDVVIQLEPDLFRAELNRAQAALEIRKANYQESLNAAALLKIEIGRDLDTAKADLDSAQALFSSTEAAIVEAKNELQSNKADALYLKENYYHLTQLYKKQVTSELEYKNAKRQHESKAAIVDALKAKVQRLTNLKEVEKTKVSAEKTKLQALQESRENLLANADMQVNTAKAAVEVAQAEFDLAKLNLDRTQIRAKRNGYISNRRTSSGDYIEIGQPIASIVSCQEKPWIQANFKETQVGEMKRGQKAIFTIDTYPGVKFEGELQSISSGSGSIFSVLPPENASGNFTKVVKRMPVIISISDPKNAVFRIGASANVKVYTE